MDTIAQHEDSLNVDVALRRAKSKAYLLKNKMVKYQGLSDPEIFKTVIVRGDGRLNSKPLSQEYFIKWHIPHVWEWFIEFTKDFEHMPLKARAHIAAKGVIECPRCACGNKVGFADGKISKFCGWDCAKKSPEKLIAIGKIDTKEAARKRKATMLEKFGYEYNTQRPEIRRVISEYASTQLSTEIKEKLDDTTWLHYHYIVLQEQIQDIANQLDVDSTTVRSRIIKNKWEIRQKSTYSLQEKMLWEYLEENNINFNKLVWLDWMEGKEIDIIFPEHSLAIECDGTRYHHDLWPSRRCPTYHLDKTNLCKKNGIKLIHLADYEITKKFDIVSQLIRERLGMCEIINGDKVTPYPGKIMQDCLRILTFKSVKIEFGYKIHNNKRHIANVGFVLFRDGYSMKWSNEQNHQCSNLIRLAAEEYFKTHEDHLYIENDVRLGEESYTGDGFEYVDTTPIDFFWTNGNPPKEEAELIKKLKIIDLSISNEENFRNNNYGKFWDCGANIWKYKQTQ